MTPKVRRVACVGDSITEGAAIDDRSLSYPALLGRSLDASWLVENFGKRRSTLLSKGNDPYCRQPEFAAALAFRPDVVVFLLGSNDAKPVNWIHGREFDADYRALVRQFLDLPSRPVVFACLPIPCFPPGNFTIDGGVIQDQIIPRIRAIARELALPIIDLNSPFQGRPELTLDCVHPTEAGSRLIAETVRHALLSKIKPTRDD